MSKCAQCAKEREPNRSLCSLCLAAARKCAADRRLRLQSSGKCNTCGVDPTPGFKTCDKCREYRRRLQSKRRSNAAKCTECLEPVTTGEKRCAACKAKRKEREQKLKDKGICVQCRGAWAVAGKTLCPACIEKAVHESKARWGRRVASGRCPRCDAEAQDGRKSCRACRDKELAAQRQMRQQRKASGRCVGCGNPPVSNVTLCTTCYLRTASSRFLGTRTRWMDLKELFDRQEGKCPYLGCQLTLGVNTSVDHIVPKSRGGADDIGNFQWVHKTINTMKWNHSEEEFLAMIEMIKNHQRNSPGLVGAPTDRR